MFIAVTTKNDSKGESAAMDAEIDEELQAAANELLNKYGPVQAKDLVMKANDGDTVDINTLYRAQKGIGKKGVQAKTRIRILNALEFARRTAGEVRPAASHNRTEDRMVEVYRERAPKQGLPEWEALTDQQRKVWEMHWDAYMKRLIAAEESFLQVALHQFESYILESDRKIL